jgi:ribonuclease HIII
VTSHTQLLSKAEGDVLEKILRAGNYELKEVQYARVCGLKKNLVVTLYNSGKVVVQGKGTPEFIEFVLEPEVLKAAKVGYETVLDPTLTDPRIGVDESGKGDFFGPMCIAGVYVNASVLAAWKSAGVRDSKTVGSDAQMARLAEIIRKTPGCVYNVVAIGNEAYNRLFKKLQSINKMLAWGHARVIENLMGLRYQMNPPPLRVISDQFAATEETVRVALMSMGRDIKLVQRHKAESDLAVAAASILARHEFVTRLKRLGDSHGITMPKGASPEVEKVGKQLVEKYGPEILNKVGKEHFRTSYRILGLPEPPVKKWKRPPKKNPGPAS